MSETKVVVITGASEGIGAELARQLGAQGHSLVLAARRQAALEEVAATCGGPALAVSTDVTWRADVEALREAALARFGRVDVWVNNAGRGINRKVMELTDEDFDDMMAVNVKSALYGMQAIVPYFQVQGRGHLINVSSFLGRVPAASFRSAYNAAKHALNSLTANLRMDLMREHPEITVTLVMPGPVATRFSGNALHSQPAPAAAPANRPAGSVQVQTATEVAEAIRMVIDHPAAEVFTNPPQREMAQRYYQDVAAYEAGMMRR